MSSNTNFTCRETYYSYGSYLRSRGYDKEICNLVAAIEAGQIKIGPITPGSCPSAPTTINNSVTINGCPSGPTSTTGILKVTGGNIGPVNVDPSGSITSFLSGSTNYGIQSSTGIRNLGPIYSSTDCSRSNYFGAVNHIFAGGSSGDCSTNVIVRGNLLVDGSTVEISGFIGETLTLITLPGNSALGTLNLFRSPLADGNTITVYNDTSDNILAGNWQTGLTFSIDGNLENTTTGSGIDRIAGMSDTQGHVRSFRGITVSNPPSAGQAIDICYNRDISGSSYALQVYGDLTIDRGNNDASGNIDLSGGDINFYLNNNKNAYIHANGDASFNGHVTIYDLSVINVMTVGTSTTYIDANDVSTNNLNANNVNAGFLIVDNSLNTSFIYSPLLQDLTIQAGAANVEFVANKVIIDDLSVNQISANSININIAVFNTINTTDLSVNHHASIYDLSVTNLLNVGDVTITQTQVQTNTLRSTNTNPLTIQGGTSGTENINVSATNVNMRDNVSLVTISDLSVNDISASQIDVTNIDVSSIITSNTINNTSKITTTDLSVNSHASIYDLSVQHILTVGISTEILSDTVRTSLVDCGNLQVSDSAQFNNNINVSNTIYTTDLSVNGHASVYDLSVINVMTVGISTTTITTDSIDTTTINATNINITDGSFNHIIAKDISVNDILQIGETIIQSDSITVTDLIISGELDISGNLIIGNETDGGAFLDVCGTLLVNSGNNNMFINTSINPNTNQNSSTIGYNNLAIGQNAMSYPNTLDQDASANVAIGYNSLAKFQFGSFNTSVGANSLTNYEGNSNSIGENTAFGAYSMSNFIGNNQDKDSNNTAIGAYSLQNILDGSNTALGYKAGQNDISGNGNTYLGAFTDTNDNSQVFINSTAVGVNSKIGKSNTIILGDSSNSNLNVGIKTNAPQAELHVVGNLIVTGNINANTLDTSFNSFYDLSVNNNLDVNNNLTVGYKITSTDLSVNGHASIYDLSVTNLMTVGTSIDTNSINAISGIFDNSLNVNDNFSVNHSTGMIDFSAIDVTFNNSLKIYKTGDTNYIQTPYGISNDNLFIYTEGRFNLDVSQNMVISGNEQIDITSAGFTEITAGQGIDLSANQDITFTATDVSFINVSNVYFGNSVVDISDLKIGSRISTSKIVSPNDELQISSIQNGMTFTSLSGDISFTSNKSGFFVDASQGITFQGHSSSVYFYGNSANFVDMSVNMLDLSVNNIITNSIDTNNSSNIISFGNTRLHDISSIIVENSIITKSVLSSSSNLTVGAVNGNLNLDSLGGNININAGNNDISFNADTITFDASVCFLKDPSIKEVDFSGRELKIYGSSTIIFDISGPYKSTVGNFVPSGTTDLSFVIPPVYNDLNPPSLFNSIFTENYIDFSNNQTAVTNMLFEVYLSISAKFTNSNDALIFQFINVDNSSNVVDIDTRSGNILNSFNTVVFGPVNIVSKPGADDDFIKKQWKIGVTQYGSGVKIHSDPRLTIKMKSIV